VYLRTGNAENEQRTTMTPFVETGGLTVGRRDRGRWALVGAPVTRLALFPMKNGRDGGGGLGGRWISPSRRAG